MKIKKKVQIIVSVVIILIATIITVFFFIFGKDEEPANVKVIASGYEKIIVNDQKLNTLGATLQETVDSSFEKIAENDQLELFVEEDTLAIGIRDKSKGTFWYSYDVHANLAKEGYSPEIINYIESGVSITTYDGNTPGRKTLLDQGVKKEITPEENGFRVSIDYTVQKIKFDLLVLIQGGDLIVNIPRESVEEYNKELGKSDKNNIYLSEITIFPFLAGTEGQDNSYAVIPDGAGAIVNLTEVPKSTDGYTGFVYGKDNGYENNPKKRKFSSKPLEQVTLPIYGVIEKENERGILVISENGESYANYNYRPKNTDTKYYQSYFTYTYRTAYTQFQSRVNEDKSLLKFQDKVNSFDVVQRYVFLDNDQANYVGVAKKYRNFLEKKYQFGVQQDTPVDTTPMKLDFINNEVKMGNLGIEEIVLTSYQQAEKIVDKLSQKGFGNLNVTFKTFNQDDWRYGFKVLKSLGGQEQLKKALSTFKRSNVNFDYYLDYTKTFYKSTDYAANKLNRSLFTVVDPENEMIEYINNPKYYRSFAKKDENSLKDFPVDAIALAGLQANVFTNFDEGKITNSLTNIANTTAMVESFKKSKFKTNMYNPNAYLFPYLDKYYDAPYYSSGLSFKDATVPLLQLILSGHSEMFSPYLNNASNDQETILKLIEFGTYPSFIMTGETAYHLKETPSNNVAVSELSYLEERMARYQKDINQVLLQVAGAEMINHQIIQDGVIQVTYSNGKTIYINYNDTDYSINGTLVAAKGVMVK